MTQSTHHLPVGWDSPTQHWVILTWYDKLLTYGVGQSNTTLRHPDMVWHSPHITYLWGGTAQHNTGTSWQSNTTLGHPDMVWPSPHTTYLWGGTAQHNTGTSWHSMTNSIPRGWDNQIQHWEILAWCDIVHTSPTCGVGQPNTTLGHPDMIWQTPYLWGWAIKHNTGTSWLGLTQSTHCQPTYLWGGTIKHNTGTSWHGIIHILPTCGVGQPNTTLGHPDMVRQTPYLGSGTIKHNTGTSWHGVT